MTAVLFSSAKRRIRALNGPLRDATFDPSVRLTIGRGCECDIQIVHDGVSRQHACITIDAQGRHVLVDLNSTNGTFIDHQKVDRTPLEIGTVFEIMRNRLIYEEELNVGAPLQDTAIPRNAGIPALRTTIAYSAFKSKDVEQNRLSIAPPLASGGEQPSGTDGENNRVCYRGDLIGDIAEYRSLRTRILRGEPQSIDQGERFRELEHRMRPPGAAISQGSRRSYNRFSCNVPAHLRLFTGDELPVDLVDIGVDGARVSLGKHSISIDMLLWVAIDRATTGTNRTLVFPGRAAWIRAGGIGVSFSGAPGWSLRRGSKERGPTLRDLGPKIGRLQLVRAPRASIESDRQDRVEVE